jgi:hypothetical protein
LDTETGKHYNYFRDYDPAIGRYIESDPIGLAGGLNNYGYAGGAPVIARDPEGLKVSGSWGGFSVGDAGVSDFGFTFTPPRPDLFGYINIGEISATLSGTVSADVSCRDDTCSAKNWTVHVTVPVSYRGGFAVGPNVIATAIGSRAGLAGAIGANIVLGAAKGAYGANEVRRKYGQAAALALVELINRGADAICIASSPFWSGR